MLYFIIGLILVLGIYFMSAYNGFVKLRNMKDEAFATMDVYLKKRYDLIPNLVETVKGYASHEKDTLEKVIAARNMAASATSVEDKMAGENALQGTLKTLFAVAESYPDLKANQNFMDLQKQLQSLEGEIAQSRKYYNGVVKEYNTKTEVFPSNIIAGIFGFMKAPYFEIEEGERENVKVSF
ncbi:LemA family protein [Clostridia bacterium]|nr:LemA family protein [Clostridia bacterium]